MDKLQPFIKYHFWLLFVPAFLMPPLAWWLTTSDLQATISERTGVLDTSFGSISTGQNTPNDDWIAKAEDLIRIRETTNTRTVDRLWEWQKPLVKWPQSVAQWMNVCPYRGEITDNSIARRVPIDYRRNYGLEVRRVWLLSEPIGPDSDRIPPKAVKKVWFPLSQMPQVPAEKWQNLPPSFIEIWNSQEDLWLLEQLMLAVQRTNSSSNNISDSFVREIREVGLFGGERVAADQVPAAESSNSSNPMMGQPRLGPGNRTTGRRIPTSARFDLAQEYKIKGFTGVTSRRSGGGGSDFASAAMSSMQMTADSNSSSTSSNEADDLNLDENRYVTVADAYRTRGFHLVVTIHQQYIPDLVRELLDSQYPIDITRMEQVARNPDEPDGSGTNQNSGPSRFGPMAGGPGKSGGIPGATESAEMEMATLAGGEETDTADAFSESPEGETSSTPITDSAVQIALGELDLVEFAIVGEMYLYNPPKPPEGEEAAAPASSSGTTPETTPGTITEPQPADVTGASGTPETPPSANTEPGTTPEPATPETPVNDGSQPATGGTPTDPSATPQPAPLTPNPVKPASETPPPAVPKPAVPEPEPPAG